MATQDGRLIKAHRPSHRTGDPMAQRALGISPTNQILGWRRLDAPTGKRLKSTPNPTCIAFASVLRLQDWLRRTCAGLALSKVRKRRVECGLIPDKVRFWYNIYGCPVKRRKAEALMLRAEEYFLYVDNREWCEFFLGWIFSGKKFPGAGRGCRPVRPRYRLPLCGPERIGRTMFPP